MFRIAQTRRKNRQSISWKRQDQYWWSRSDDISTRFRFNLRLLRMLVCRSRTCYYKASSSTKSTNYPADSQVSNILDHINCEVYFFVILKCHNTFFRILAWMTSNGRKKPLFLSLFKIYFHFINSLQRILIMVGYSSVTFQNRE